jgi:hypothetical protein
LGIANVSIKTALLAVVGVLAVAVCVAAASDSRFEAGVRTPILVELFTSEGCSSCPPADRFLEKLDGQPLAGAEMIVLSEHVDYWNHIGWKDPYSARFYSERQSQYARRFGLDSVYTPQMVVDGSSEFGGGDSERANTAFGKALRIAKMPVHLSAVSIGKLNSVHAHVETGALDSSYGSRTAEVYTVLALNHAQSQVSAGENAGHRLEHVSVARKLVKITELKEGEHFSQDLEMKLEPRSDPRNLRLIVFVQQAHQGRVLGAALAPVVAP